MELPEVIPPFKAHMEIPLFSWHSLLVTATASLFFFFLLWRRQSLPLPPGPPAWPVVGNLLLLGKRPHESLYALSLQYGPLMTLRLGMKTAVIVSSPAMARDFLKTHDHVFAGRTVLQTAKSLSHHKSSVVCGEYGAHWRNLRRISTVELFSPKRMEALQHLRRDQVFHTIRLLYDDKGKVVDIGRTVLCTSLNLLGNMILSTSVFDPHDPASAGLKDSIWQLMKLGATPNLSDFYPLLRFFDPQGLCRETAKHFKGMYDFVDSFIQERLGLDPCAESVEQNDSKKDFLDVLLDLRSEDFTVIEIRALISDFFIAGVETTTTTIEWAMAEFIRNPHKLKRVQEELDEIVGCNRRVEESDLDKLPYLHAAVKETFRLHQTVPLLLPHKAMSTCEVAGFVIPKDTQVIVNAWAIGRDPAIWSRPSEFVPERFFEGENRKIDYRGQNFELIPFGSGRRICPGLPLASRMVNFVLASLLHSFEWKLPEGMSCEQMDMADEFGLSLKKAVELKAIPVPRLPFHLY